MLKKRNETPAAVAANLEARDPEAADHELLSHKFALGAHAEAAHEEPRQIPWGYADDRVTAMAVDPDHLYIYWEVTDAAIERARSQLGLGGPDAWLDLRFYDTTGRIFDGTNAHSYLDVRVERGDRQYFADIGKPTSETVVEVGMRSFEGFFVRIARSGRVVFPRREPVGWAEPEWMAVRLATGEVQALGGSGAAPTPPPPQFESRPPEPTHELPAWRIHIPWEMLVRSGLEAGQSIEWETLREDFSESWYAERRAFSWGGADEMTSWEAGPFSYPVELIGPAAEAFTGPLRRYQVGGVTRIVEGPWQIVIRGLGLHRRREIIARWEVRWAWVVGEGGERAQAGTIPAVVPGASERRLAGASERRWLAASELRLLGASERQFLGASDRRLLGASETLYAGASAFMFRGASELRLRGASERRLAGASERRWLGGASEHRLGGASEHRLGGASEHRLGGASEHRLGGASERSGGHRNG